MTSRMSWLGRVWHTIGWHENLRAGDSAEPELGVRSLVWGSESFGFTILGFGSNFVGNGGMFIYINSLEIVMEKGVLALRLMIFFGVVLALAGNVLAVPQTFSIHGKLSDSGGPLEGTYSMNFSVYTSYSGGAFLWTDTYSVTTNNLGVYDVILTDLDLPFSVQYYLGVNVAGDGEMVPRMNLTSSGYSFRANVSDYLDSTRNYEVANLTLGQKLSFAFGEVVDNIVNGWVRVTGGLNVTGNVEVGGNLSMGSGYIHDLANGSAAQDAVTKSQLDAVSATVSGDFVPYTGADSNLVLGDNNFSVGGSDLFVDSISGRVGVGTVAPGAKLVLGTSGDVLGLGTNDIESWTNIAGAIESLDTSIFFGQDTDFWFNSNAYYSSGWKYKTSDYAANMGMYKGDIQFRTAGSGSADLGISWTTTMHLDKDGNVGIGTTEPGYALDVIRNADEQLRVGRSVSKYVAVRDDVLRFHGMTANGMRIQTDDAADIHFMTDGLYRMVIGKTGNVGIGTTSPQQELHVNGSVVINGTLDMDSGKITNLSNGTAAQDAVTYSQLLGINATVSGDYVPYTGADSNLVLGDNNLSVGGSDLFVDNVGGKVGIGTGAPGTSLQVVGAVQGSGLIRSTGGTATGATGPGVEIQYITSSGGYALLDGYDRTASDYIPLRIDGKNLSFHTSAGTSDMFIEAGGNVGIGTTAPAEKLHVVGGEARFDDNISIQPTKKLFLDGGLDTYITEVSANAIAFWTGGAEYMRINSGGNVGIGETDPSAKLHVLDGDSQLILEKSASGYFTGQGFDGNDPYYTYYSGTGMTIGYGSVTAGAPTVDTMFLGNTGNVGIGTTSPQEELHVNGSVVINGTLDMDSGQINNLANGTAAQDAVTYSQLLGINATVSGDYVPYTGADSNLVLGNNNFSIGGSDLFVDNVAGRVGIGTASPTNPLHVIGTIYSSTDIEANSNIVGYGSVRGGYNNDGTAGAPDFTFNGDTNTGMFSDTADTLAFTTASTEAMRIQADGDIQIMNGDVGIGTASPDEVLDVNGNVKVGTRKAMEPSTWGYSSGYKTLILGSSGTNYQTDAVTISMGYDPSGNSDGSFTGDGREILFRNGAKFTTPNAADDDFHTNVLVLKDGKVGIGTASPEKKLHIYDGSAGTIVPYADGLVIENDGRASINLHTPATSDSYIFFGSPVSANRGYVGYNHNVDDMVFYTSDDYVFNNGDVGIGTASPGRKLDVVGNVRARGYFEISESDGARNGLITTQKAVSGAGTDRSLAIFAENSGNDIHFMTGGSATTRMFVEDTGNVGIGTTSPQNELNVAGDANITGAMIVSSMNITVESNGDVNVW